MKWLRNLIKSIVQEELQVQVRATADKPVDYWTSAFQSYFSSISYSKKVPLIEVVQKLAEHCNLKVVNGTVQRLEIEPPKTVSFTKVTLAKSSEKKTKK